jgi:hypothetical protein
MQAVRRASILIVLLALAGCGGGGGGDAGGGDGGTTLAQPGVTTQSSTDVVTVKVPTRTQRRPARPHSRRR